MKKGEIKVGGLYLVKVSGQLTTVRVDAIRGIGSRLNATRNYLSTTRYDVTNLRTGRLTTFRSAAKFRCEVREKPCPQCKQHVPVAEDYPFGMHRACYERSGAARLDKQIADHLAQGDQP